MKRFYVFLLAVLGFGTACAQNITMPDSVAVIRNHVKSVKVYFKPENGERSMNLYLVYDKQGRLIREGQGESTYYYAYGYDNKGRRVTHTQRTAKGEFIQKYSTEFLEKDSLKKVSLFQAIDTMQPTHIYYHDAAGNKVRQEVFSNGKLIHLQIIKYDAKGSVVYAYDSTANNASIRKDEQLVKIRKYSPKNELLHDYTYKYGPLGVTDIIDSVSPKNVTRYKVFHEQYARIESAERNGKKMTEAELINFKKEFAYVLPLVDDHEGQYGLPVPETINEHKLTYDRKGNITRDELTQKQGSFSQTYVYEYEYAYY